jgi:chromosome segregation ATPase
MFTPSLFFLLISLVDLRPSLFTVLANDLKAA